MRACSETRWKRFHGPRVGKTSASEGGTSAAPSAAHRECINRYRAVGPFDALGTKRRISRPRPPRLPRGSLHRGVRPRVNVCADEPRVRLHRGTVTRYRDAAAVRARIACILRQSRHEYGSRFTRGGLGTYRCYYMGVLVEDSARVPARARAGWVDMRPRAQRVPIAPWTPQHSSAASSASAMGAGCRTTLFPRLASCVPCFPDSIPCESAEDAGVPRRLVAWPSRLRSKRRPEPERRGLVPRAHRWARYKCFA